MGESGREREREKREREKKRERKKERFVYQLRYLPISLLRFHVLVTE